MDIMYSPHEIKHTNIVRMGVNKKKHIIKGKRYLKIIDTISHASLERRNNTDLSHNSKSVKTYQSQLDDIINKIKNL